MNSPADPAPAPSKAVVSAAIAKRAMKETLDRVKKLGTGAADLLRRLKKDHSPEAMIDTLERSLAANAARREPLAARVEELYTRIAARKRDYAAAPPARKRIIETELKSLLASYKAAERELSVLLENETLLARVRGRISEVMAYDLAGVSEEMIDDLAVDIDDRVVDAEARLDAARELDRAARRRDRESDREDLWAELDGFEEAERPSDEEDRAPVEPHGAAETHVRHEREQRPAAAEPLRRKDNSAPEPNTDT